MLLGYQKNSHLVFGALTLKNYKSLLLKIGNLCYQIWELAKKDGELLFLQKFFGMICFSLKSLKDYDSLKRKWRPRTNLSLLATTQEEIGSSVLDRYVCGTYWPSLHLLGFSI